MCAGRVQLACTAAVAIGTVLYVVMVCLARVFRLCALRSRLRQGMFGYTLFGKTVSSNILNSFKDPSDVLVQIGRIAFLLVVTFAFPLIVCVALLVVLRVRCVRSRSLTRAHVQLPVSHEPAHALLPHAQGSFSCHACAHAHTDTVQRDNMFHYLATLGLVVTAYGVAISG